MKKEEKATGEREMVDQKGVVQQNKRLSNGGRLTQRAEKLTAYGTQD